jgi:drug/metabolite transporter (DMT)-like permease
MLIALAGFSMFSIGDGVVKSMAGQFPGTGVALIRYLIGSFGLGAALILVRGRAGFVCPRPTLQLGRAIAVSFASIGFFVGVQYMPLANATSIQFTTPMLTALLSALVLKERASAAVWVATALAFIGVMIVLRPQVFLLGTTALYPLGAALGMAFLMIFNRMAGGLTPLLESQFLISIIATPILACVAFTMHMTGLKPFQLHIPDWGIIARCAVVAVTGTSSHWLIFMATQRGTAAIVSPMMYVQLLMAVLIGLVFFHNVPTLVTLAGAAIIIAGGLYLGWDTQRRAQTELRVDRLR